MTQFLKTGVLFASVLTLTGAFVVPAFAVGDLSVLVKNVSSPGCNPGALVGGARVVLYDSNWNYLDEDDTNDFGNVVFQNLAAGLYRLEAYQLGEYWVNDSTTVNDNSVTYLTLVRNEPYAYDFDVYKGFDNVTGDDVELGCDLDFEIRVRNCSPVERVCRLKIWLNKDQSFSSPFFSSSQSVGSNGGSKTWSFGFTPSSSGRYYRSFEVQTWVNNHWVKTDFWDWDLAFEVIDPCDPITCLDCTFQDWQMSLSWCNPGGWDAALVKRNGTVIATLPGGATGYTDTSVPSGTSTYEIVGVCGSQQAPPSTTCYVDVAPCPGVSNLGCFECAGDVRLSWGAASANFSQIRIFRDSQEIALLPGGATEFVDNAVSVGSHSYEVQSYCGPANSAVANCSVVVPPMAEIDVRLSVKIISGSNGELPPGIDEDVVRDHVCVANNLLRSNATGMRLDVISVDVIGGTASDHYEMTGSCSAFRDALEAAAQADPGTYLHSDEAINIYYVWNNNADCSAVCSFPPTDETIVMGHYASGDTLLHEIGHFFSLCHTQGCPCAGCSGNGACTLPGTDEIDDTLPDVACWDFCDIASNEWSSISCTSEQVNNLSPAQVEQVRDVLYNIMSYHSNRDRLTPGQIERWRDCLMTERSHVSAYALSHGVENTGPAHGADCIDMNAPLEWTEVDGVSYDVYWGTTNPPPFWRNVTGEVAYPSHQSGETYFWTVRARNACGASRDSGIWSYTTASSLSVSPVLQSPFEGADCQPVAVCLEWGIVSGTTSYDVYWGTEDPPPFWGNVTGNSACPPSQDNETYFWNIQAKNSCTSSPASSTWSYTTGAAPGEPTNLNPHDGAMDVPTSTLLSWSPGDCSDSFDVYLDGAFQGNTTETSFDPGILDPGRSYTWRVEGVNHASGQKTPGQTWSFVTVGVDFIRGDCNGDDSLDVSDVITLLFFFYVSGVPECLDACDTNDDGFLQLDDAIDLINYLAGMAPAPPSPFLTCDADPTSDQLLCLQPQCP